MEIKNTKTIQLASLDCFMRTLGYRRQNTTYVWEYSDLRNIDCMNISFRTAVRLHNENWELLEGSESYVDSTGVFKVDSYTYNRAKGSRIVKVVKIQATKHKQFLVQSHMTSFMFGEYYQLFLGGDK